jgi:hypothetical protein
MNELPLPGAIPEPTPAPRRDLVRGMRGDEVFMLSIKRLMVIL